MKNFLQSSTEHAIDNLSQNEHNATTVTRDFAALTTTHNLSAYGGHAADWLGRQVWLFTPNRLVGLVCVESLKTQQACSIDGVLQFVTAFNSKNDQKGIKSIGGDTFNTGLLNTKFHRHDYEGIEAESAPSKFTHITLFDKEGKAAGGDTLSSMQRARNIFTWWKFTRNGQNRLKA